MSVTGRARLLASAVLVACLLRAAGDTDEEPPATGNAGAALNQEQQQAVGLEVARARAARAPEREAALGRVLDPEALRTDLETLRVATVAEHTSAVELERLRALHAGGAQASQRMVEGAEAERAKAKAELSLAHARLLLEFGPIATQAREVQERLADESLRGETLLVRADLPGRHTIGSVPPRALLEVDGIEVPGRVLGVLRSATEIQSAALLIEMPHAPPGIAVGARLPVVLLGGVRSGFALPRDAVLYDEHGAYVYKRIGTAGKNGAKTPVHYVPVTVKLLAPLDSGWLVEGIDDDDDIVVAGAGVLWSLQGVGARAEDEDEDED